MALSREERAWMVSQVLVKLLPIYGPFPLPETVERHRQLSLALHCRRRSLTKKDMGHLQEKLIA